jgi:integrase
MPIRSISSDVVASWYRDQLATGRATQSARAYGLLSSVMKTALQQKVISENPCSIRGAANARTGKKVTPPTPIELDRMVAAIEPRFRAALLIAAWAGTRYGELTELRRKDIKIVREDREVRRITVNVDRAVTNATGHGFIVGKTKSEAGVRLIELPPHIFQPVLDHLGEFVADFPESLLFPAADGVTHLSQTSFYKYWDKARNAAGRGDMPFHALRHYGATRFAMTGATLKEIQARLGHSTVDAAMRYQHAAGRDEELARRMSELADAGYPRDRTARTRRQTQA